MPTTLKRLVLATAVMLLAVCGACSSTQINSTWKAPDIRATGLHKVLVIARVPHEPARRILEDSLAQQLQERGVQAIPASRVVNEAQLTRDSVRALVKHQAFDAVLVARYLGTSQQMMYVPTTYDAYFGPGPVVFEPGAYQTETKVHLEFRLFDVNRGGQMVWTASTSTIDPTSANKAAPGVAKEVVARLEKDLRMGG